MALNDKGVVKRVLSLDYYEEMLMLMDLFTSETISQQMWQAMGIIYEAFARDGFDYFTGM